MDTVVARRTVVVRLMARAVAGVFLVAATISYAQTTGSVPLPKTDDSASATDYHSPGYGVPPGARDPFFPPRKVEITSVPEDGDGGTGAVPPEETPLVASGLSADDFYEALQLQAVMKLRNNFVALVNGTQVRKGEILRVTIQGKSCDLEVESITARPPRVSLRHGNQVVVLVVGM